jgi:hypothetical protein
VPASWASPERVAEAQAQASPSIPVAALLVFAAQAGSQRA